MFERDCTLYLADILDSGQAILSYVKNLDFEQFSTDRMRHAAVIREFEVIGEAVGKLPESLKEKYPDVPWREIKDFRNLPIHQYFGVDLRIVWNTVHQDLPALLSATSSILHGE
ncbi:DUF86 domain-containing protein [Magnetovirga frankeli]|uniref:HepT-like ribonuclease domain-containing protein n=1 Tax=Magnetovirga frankeli TaxID=947516 RepID=UPI001293EDC0|nr:DUF86 domain-containing protein [gamma proteobacterium SS-5]